MYGNGPGKRQGAPNNSSLTRRRTVNLTLNHGYDTATGFYQAISGDHLAFRYETL